MRRPSRLTLIVCSALALAAAAYTQSASDAASDAATSPPPVREATATAAAAAATEAPAAFDGRSNGFISQAEFDEAKDVFDEQEFNNGQDGLGPVYNAQSCGECHQAPVSGGISQVTELRAGRYDPVRGFVNPPGGSLINDRAIDAAFQEYVPAEYNVRTLRTSLNTLGDGFVEAIDNQTIVDIARSQPATMRGQVIQVPVLEAGGVLRVGRFGWKNQHASLESFSGDAYLNEAGITTPMFPTDNTSMGRTTTHDGRPISDHTADPEDDGADIEIFANFMRATKAPPRDAALAATTQARAGANVFTAIGCAVCHVTTIQTAPPGTPINGGDLTVPEALGNKVIHPFSDFLLHDVGTGDGIVQNGGAATRNKLRTAPLWGVRTRSRLMHDGLSLTFNDAILRHGGQAASVTASYRNLSAQQKANLVAFLKSL